MKIDLKNKLDASISFKISRFKEIIKRTKPHKHSEYYEFIFILEGEGFHTINTNTYTIYSPEFYILAPNQLHFWQFTSIPKGFVLLLKDTEFNKLTESTSIEMIHQLVQLERVNLSDNKIIFTLLEDILNEWNEDSTTSKDIIHEYISIILKKLLRNSTIDTNSIQSSLYEKYISLVRSNITNMRKVNEYADVLCTTPQNLNSVCRKNASMSASEIISNQLILEIKRYLLHTDNSINEIADILNFEDSSNFVKYFKRNEGITPKQFRSNHFQ